MRGRAGPSGVGDAKRADPTGPAPPTPGASENRAPAWGLAGARATSRGLKRGVVRVHPNRPQLEVERDTASLSPARCVLAQDSPH